MTEAEASAGAEPGADPQKSKQNGDLRAKAHAPQSERGFSVRRCRPRAGAGAALRASHASGLDWLVLPPLRHNQFSVARARAKDGGSAPVAVALGANVLEEVDRTLWSDMSLVLRLRRDEWASGYRAFKGRVRRAIEKPDASIVEETQPSTRDDPTHKPAAKTRGYSPHGRHARQMFPLLNLAAAASITWLLTSHANALERDLRNDPVPVESYFTALNFEPLIDRKYITDRLAGIVLTLDVNTKSIRPTVQSMRPLRPLTYHIKIRVDAGKYPYQALTFDLPGTQQERSWLPEHKSYVAAIEQTVEQIARIGALVSEYDASKADILVHIDLAERAATSEGFTYETMPAYPERRGQTQREKLNRIVYVLPWTIVRLYQRGEGTRQGVRNSIEGAEIWIQYPLRTFWQESLAELLIDDESLAAAVGIGHTPRELAQSFRTPHKTVLEPIVRSLMQQRARWPAPRPGESLLSAAASVLQDSEDRGAPTGPEDWYAVAYCMAKPHAATLAARVGRALSIIASGLRGNALMVSPSGDYSSEFFRDSDAFLAQLSLASRKDGFDQRFDDRLTMLALASERQLHGGRALPDIPVVLWRDEHPANAKLAADNIVRHQPAELRNALIEAGRSMTRDCYDVTRVRRTFGIF